MLTMLHQQLRAERIKKKITVRELAERMNIRSKKGNLSWYVIQKIEKGMNVNYSSYLRYAAALGLKIETKLKSQGGNH